MSNPARISDLTKLLLLPLLLACALLLAACGEDKATCKPGSANCACTSKDPACDGAELSCVQGICRICENGSCIPAEPKCYSPCRGSFIDGAGKQRICSQEGLVEGCLTGSTCEQGSCVPHAAGTSTKAAPGPTAQAAPSGGSQGGAPSDDNAGLASGGGNDDSTLAQPIGTCVADPDCPEHQVCIQKRCYSTCDSDDECGGGSTCRKKVCRQLCDDKTPCSGLNYSCQKIDNTSSVCLPQVEKTAELSAAEPAAQLGSFSLALRDDCAAAGSCPLTPLLFNTNHTEGAFVIVNSSPVDRVFHVSKQRQSEVTSDGNDEAFFAARGENPLPWLEIGPDGGAQRAAEVSLTIPANSRAKFVIRSARNEKLARWQGALQVATSGLGSQEVDLGYSEQVPGNWGGNVYYFGNFGDHSQDQDQLGNWIAHRDDVSLAQKVPNAFIRAWANFRAGRVSKSELDAVIDAIVTGSWDFDRTKVLCAMAKGGVCAPYAGAANRSVVSITSDPKTAPVPSGVVQLGVSLSLGDGAESAACGGDANCFAGRIDSAQALQYPNNPSVVLRFADDPTKCAADATPCLAMLSDFHSEVVLGARFNDPSGQACGKAIDFGDKQLPWLVPGTRAADGSLVSGVHECRDSALPFADKASDNIELAAANPVPDGMQRLRTLDLVDGMMVEQDLMLVIFRESLESFLGTKNDVFSSYGLMVLKRQPAEPKPDELVGSSPAAPGGTRAPQPLAQACSSNLLSKIFPDQHYQKLSEVPADARTDSVSNLIDGRNASPGGAVKIELPEQAHYLCTWSDLAQNVDANQGSSNGTQTGSAASVTRYQIDGKCPRFARVVYFTLAHEPADDTLLSCNRNDSCAQQLIDWGHEQDGYVRLPPSEAASSPVDAAFDLTWSCTDGSPLCDNYDNLTAGKTFYKPVEGQAVFNPLLTDIKQAFRYKFQFQNRSGQSVGFAPAICDPTSALVPYCYSPSEIADVTERLNCALSVYDDHASGAVKLDGASVTKLHDALVQSYGFKQFPNVFGDPSVEDGFERLNAELQVMLGDDAYTAAFASRFDLAGSQVQAFQGSQFEAGGIDLTGVAGHEMYKLYQASQYYGLVLDRFFGESPILWRSLQTGDKNDAVPTSATVTGYLSRVIRASTQLSNTASEIARRYQAFNRPDLARRVIERGYARSYLESQILSQFMKSVQESISGSEQDQVTVAVADAQRSYRVAMLDMQNAYKRITEDRTIFGFAPDYIPFPALSEKDDGAFPVIMARAKDRLAVADTDEQRALATSRSFETDSAAFQGELVKISSSFEKQLGDLCGTFVGSDGKTYPAIVRYKHLSSKYDSVSDPCGLERGTIYDKAGDIGTDDLELRKAMQTGENLVTQSQELVQRIDEQCEITKDSTDKISAIQDRINAMQGAADALSTYIAGMDRRLNVNGTLLQASMPELGLIPSYVTQAGVTLAATGAFSATIDGLNGAVRTLQNEQAVVAGYAACGQFAAEGIYEVQDIHRNILLNNIDILEAQGNLDVVKSQLSQLQNERIRLESQWDDNSQLAINVQAAKNDPNVRIYKNDAIINADASFNEAVQYAYRATKVFEYYTGQSYAALDKLFLVRMVSSGDVNLTQYLAQLEDAFFAFEEQFGKPATRVAVISLRDDVFNAPLYAQAAGARQLPLAERVASFRTQLMSDKLVDNDGNIVVPFSTSFSQLSPLTNDHKILFLEAAIESSDHGDDVGRLYVRQLGASSIVNATGDKLTYAFPAHTAVLNPLFPSDSGSGRQAFDTLLGGPTASLFRDYRFRDLPFVNSSWQLVFNPRTESVNKDIHLSSIDDIKLYVYYTDFANL